VTSRPALLAVALALCAGCGDDRPAVRTAPPTSAAYRPDLFPDLPQPAGYALATDRDHIAYALGGGAVRRFAAVYVLRPGLPTDDQPERAAQELGRRLATLGWSEEQPGRWRKGAERLHVETGQAGDRPSIALRLWPADPPPRAP